MISTALEQFMPHVLEFCVVLVTCFVAFILRTVHQKLNAERKNNQFSLLSQYAEIAVKAAQQSVTSKDGAEKMKYASKFLSESAANHGLGFVSESMINTVLEAAVFAVKNDMSERKI